MTCRFIILVAIQLKSFQNKSMESTIRVERSSCVKEIDMADARFEADQPFTTLEVREIEKALGRDLPQNYVNFVKEYGGAFVGGLVDNSEDLPILKFFSAGEDQGVIGVLHRYADLKIDSALPFARDELGNIYVLNRINEVFYINYYGRNATFKKISDDFSDFLKRIVVTEV